MTDLEHSLPDLDNMLRISLLEEIGSRQSLTLGCDTFNVRLALTHLFCLMIHPCLQTARHGPGGQGLLAE